MFFVDFYRLLCGLWTFASLHSLLHENLLFEVSEDPVRSRSYTFAGHVARSCFLSFLVHISWFRGCLLAPLGCLGAVFLARFGHLGAGWAQKSPQRLQKIHSGGLLSVIWEDLGHFLSIFGGRGWDNSLKVCLSLLEDYVAYWICFSEFTVPLSRSCLSPLPSLSLLLLAQFLRTWDAFWIPIPDLFLACVYGLPWVFSNLKIKGREPGISDGRMPNPPKAIFARGYTRVASISRPGRIEAARRAARRL